jgi:hypothetical protein
MKCLPLILFACLLLSISNAQDCKKLESARFSELKFESQYPTNLVKPCIKSGNGYQLHYDSLDANCRKKLSGLFRFSSLSFSYLIVRTNKKGQIYSLELWTVLKRSDWKDSANHSPPPQKFTALKKKLEASYGKATYSKDEISSNPYVKKTNGITRNEWWECTNIRLRLRVTYASEVAAVNVLAVEIKEPGLEIADVLGEEQE